MEPEPEKATARRPGDCMYIHETLNRYDHTPSPVYVHSVTFNYSVSVKVNLSQILDVSI